MISSVAKRPFPYWHEIVLVGLVAGLLLLAEWVEPGFLAWKSQLLLSRRLWEFAILALGMTLIVITGGIDLSVGSAMGLCAVAFGLGVQATGQPIVAAMGCLLAGVLGGALNGILIARYRVHPLIVTLATYAAYRGIAEGVSQGAAYSRFGVSFGQLARGTLGGIPLPAILFLTLACVLGIMLNLTPTGRFLYAIGHNEQAVRFSGIRVDRLKFRLYTLSGFLAAVATLIYVSRFDTAQADIGKGFELEVITAVVVGGCSIFGGRGNLVGTILGLLLIHETQLLVSRHWRMEELKPIVVGALLIISVLLSQMVAKGQRAC